MSTPEVPVEQAVATSDEVVPSAPLKQAIAFASETLVPGGSNLVKGDLRQAVIHGAGALVAKSIFGLPGALLVGSNSFVKATTGRHLHEHLGLTRWPPAR